MPMVSFAEVSLSSRGSSDDSCSSTSSSSVSLGTLHWLDAPYIGGVYYAVPLAVSHLGEDAIEEGDSTATTSSFLASGVSQLQKKILAEEVDKEEEESPTPPAQR